MVKKVNKAAASAQSTASNFASQFSSLRGSALADTLRASAQQIYAAGVAQFAKAQQEGGKAFEGLVKEGVAIQRRTQAAAEERITEVTSKAAGMAEEIAAKANGQWSKLEDIFEDRVSKALKKLNIPSAADIAAINARLDALGANAPRPARQAASKASEKTSTQSAKATSKAAPARKTAAKKAKKTK